MAKRSIEIIISAENRTETALAAAKASVARYADDIKRIQQNVRVGGEGFGAGLERAQGQLTSARGRAFDLQTIAERSAAERIGYAENARFDKERYDAIRASVGATDELAGSHRKVAEAIGQGTSRMSDMERVVSRIGGALAIARMAAKGIGAAFEFGSAALKGEDLGEAAAKLMAGVAQGVPIAGGIVEPGGNFVKALHDALAGTGPEWQARIDKANAESLRAPIIAAEKAAAETRGQAQFDANVKALEAKRQAWMDQAAADKEVERVRKEEAADLEETHQRERRNVEYNDMLAAAAAKGQQEERAAAMPTIKMATGPTIFRDLRAPGGGVAAQEAGFLTGVGKYAAESAATKQLTEMAKSLKKIETGGVMMDASGEFLQWLRSTGRVPQVANF